MKKKSEFCALVARAGDLPHGVMVSMNHNGHMKLPKVPKPPRGRVVEPAWPMAEGLVHHLRNDGRWYELRGIDEKTGDLLWHPSDLSALWYWDNLSANVKRMAKLANELNKPIVFGIQTQGEAVQRLGKDERKIADTVLEIVAMNEKEREGS